MEGNAKVGLILGLGSLTIVGLIFWAVVRSKDEGFGDLDQLNLRKTRWAKALPAGGEDFSDESEYDLEVED